jgi:prophage maintenance system killer protein
MLGFLEVNGMGIDAPDPELADWIIGLSVGATPEDLASRIREASHSLG